MRLLENNDSNNDQVSWLPPEINNLLSDGDIFLTPFILLAVIIFYIRKWFPKVPSKPQETTHYMENSNDPR